MQESTQIEPIKVEGSQLIERVKQIIHEGNVRRVIIKQGEHTVVEFPLTIGVVGALLAPAVAALGAVAALITKCTIDVERTVDPVVANGQLPVATPTEELVVANK